MAEWKFCRIFLIELYGCSVKLFKYCAFSIKDGTVCDRPFWKLYAKLFFNLFILLEGNRLF